MNNLHLLRTLIRNVILEIKRTPSLTGGNINYDEFVDWADGAARVNTNTQFEVLGNFVFQWSEGDEDIKVIIHDEKLKSLRDSLKEKMKEIKPAIGYVSVSRFKDGVKINTLGIKPSARGGGLSIKIYDYILNKVGKLYSDIHQTPEARKLWVKLSQEFDTMGHYIDTGEEFPVEVSPDGKELIPVDSERSLYKDAVESSDVDVHNDDNVCLVLKSR